MAEKTEKPTQKKLNDSAKKGQILKSKDLVITAILIIGIVYLCFFFSIRPLTDIIINIMLNNFNIALEDYLVNLLHVAFGILFSFVGIVCGAACIASWLQSRFKLATESVKINFNAINPISGFKRIFNLRTVKELIKTLLYILGFAFSLGILWVNRKNIIFINLYGDYKDIFKSWSFLLLSLMIYCAIFITFIFILDFLAEYFLFMKDMKMDKEEVKREYKEQEGSPELKSKRRELHQEILSEQLKSDISNSRLIIANPTHISIGIYFKPELSPIPLVSVRETEEVALAVRRYAEKHNIPVIRNINLARALYNNHQRYDLISLEYIDKVLQLLVWLNDVEMNQIAAYASDEAEESTSTLKDEIHNSKR